MTARTLGELADGVVAAGMAPAVAIAAADADGVRAEAAAGLADPAAGLPADPRRTLFELGSIGKSVTAIVVLGLVEEGRLALDAPVAEVLPWFRVASAFAPIEVRHLLTHTAGIIGGSDIATACSFDVDALAETEAATPPGSRFHYSNVGYRALGLLVERVAGRPYPALVTERVLDPLGLADAVPVLVNDDRARIATGHVPRFDDRPWRPAHGHLPSPWIESGEADGCIAMSAVDAARYGAALGAGAHDLLGPEAAALLLRPHVDLPDDPHGSAYGYGLGFTPTGFGHTGGMIGASAALDVDRATGTAVVVVASAPWETVAPDAIAAAARAILAGGAAPVPAPPRAEPVVDDGSCAAADRPLVGIFRAFNPWAPRVRVVAQAGALRLLVGQGDAGGELAPRGDGSFRVGPEGSPERVVFDAWRDGRPQRLVLSGAAYHRSDVVSPGADA